MEYFNPKLVAYTYTDNLTKTIDFAITYLVIILLTYFVIMYIRENYKYEQVLVAEKTKAIEMQNLKLETANAEKDKLFSIVTHDLRSPLSTIQSYLEHINEDDLTNDERTYVSKQLLEMTRDTSRMLTNLLSWSKTQLGGATTSLIKLEVNQALINGLDIKKKVANKKGVQLDIKSDENLFITADPNMFELVIRNLVGNAIKFTNVGGLVMVKAIKKGLDCLITIEDNGLGMDEVVQSSLFKLNAVSTYGTNNERGIGLGLLLCKEFIDLQGGEIWFESQAGKGSIFYLSFKTADTTDLGIGHPLQSPVEQLYCAFPNNQNH